jgi:hypothetical protein
VDTQEAYLFKLRVPQGINPRKYYLGPTSVDADINNLARVQRYQLNRVERFQRQEGRRVSETVAAAAIMVHGALTEREDWTEYGSY